MNARTKVAGLAAFLAAAINVNATNPPTARVEMQDSILLPGQQSSYEVWVDTVGFPREVGAMSFYFNGLPSAVHLSDSGFYDVFTDGTFFTDGFFATKEVELEDTTIFQDRGSVGMVRTPPYIQGRNAKIVKYFFDVPAGTQSGLCAVSLSAVNLNLRNPTGEQLIDGNNLTPGSFTIVPRGDTNCSGHVDFDDINPFVTALVSKAGYETAYPGCLYETADCNGDGAVDFGDINSFVTCLVGSGCPE